jgi:hypothetical protein
MMGRGLNGGWFNEMIFGHADRLGAVEGSVQDCWSGGVNPPGVIFNGMS